VGQNPTSLILSGLALARRRGVVVEFMALP